jgi:hypothetical protein
MDLPVINLADLQIPDSDLFEIEAALQILKTKLKPDFVTLTVQQRSNFSKMGSRERLVRQALTAAEHNTADLPSSIGTAAVMVVE